jgi:hypothetical protein
LANQFQTRQWYVDTPYSSPVQLSPGVPVYIKQIEFANYNVYSDYCVVEDGNGNQVWRGQGSEELNTQRSGDIGWVTGVLVPTITAGNVNIYLK